ncbi:23S rRNA (adenine(2030)-N(6))-methyltransferase RlmJ [Cohaesibacter intestini]|uniref:23S rRNA (adenine(2030)-N(6))-methyltransferase RlmJ n=1 Tax=Cohaesibacter intestini TaxID=2211145 RepID=UPI000DEBDE55|nr:23S rRNA (adenine(2030)-N(6))-methyltransferase RlmJ [Cohaesibacter intestini]
MNYRHIYHAGNFADCLKHIVLTRILTYLQKKDKPCFCLDSHAGIGAYDLSSEEAQKTGEWQQGIARLMGPDAAPLPANIAQMCEPYLAIIRKLNPEGPITTYPGSPLLMAEMARQQDRAFFVEKHPDDAETLKQTIRRDRRFHIRQEDGWNAIKGDLPPQERRGMVLVDPPFEEKGEFNRMIWYFTQGYKRWANGIYCLWYPIKARRDVDEAAGMLKAEGIDNILRAELVINKLDTAKRLNGTGMFIINPPFMLHDELSALLPFLAERLGETARRSHLEWIAPPR